MKKPTPKKSTKKSATKKAAKKPAPVKLNVELLDRWATELESGKFRQGEGYLCSKAYNGKREYCCLGVLCHIIDPKGFKLADDGEKFEFSTQGVKQAASDVLPPSIRRQVGLSPKQQTRLIQYNDEYGLSFKEIAKHLRDRDFSVHKDKDD